MLKPLSDLRFSLDLSRIALRSPLTTHQTAWAKLRALRDGAAIASKKLWSSTPSGTGILALQHVRQVGLTIVQLGDIGEATVS